MRGFEYSPQEIACMPSAIFIFFHVLPIFSSELHEKNYNYVSVITHAHLHSTWTLKSFHINDFFLFERTVFFGKWIDTNVIPIWSFSTNFLLKLTIPKGIVDKALFSNFLSLQFVSVIWLVKKNARKISHVGWRHKVTHSLVYKLRVYTWQACEQAAA